ncbi:hypothetical protein SIIN_3274_T [Serendipita indica DSM 11827]|nr:hypothetical protein SIIN_3274_T [Serendipita indica DSM 11827]
MLDLVKSYTAQESEAQGQFRAMGKARLLRMRYYGGDEAHWGPVAMA